MERLETPHDVLEVVSITDVTNFGEKLALHVAGRCVLGKTVVKGYLMTSHDQDTCTDACEAKCKCATNVAAASSDANGHPFQRCCGDSGLEVVVG